MTSISLEVLFVICRGVTYSEIKAGAGIPCEFVGFSMHTGRSDVMKKICRILQGLPETDPSDTADPGGGEGEEQCEEEEMEDDVCVSPDSEDQNRDLWDLVP